jgi:hypothetical protein
MICTKDGKEQDFVQAVKLLFRTAGDTNDG